MLPTEQPFKTYTGLDGKPLNNGYVYFGVAGMDPITHPVTVFWDAAGTLPAAQPIRTVNGYLVNDANAPANVFYDGPYSETVIDSKGRTVFTAPTSDAFSIATAVSSFLANVAGAAGSSLVGFLQAGYGAIKRTVQDKLRDMVSVKDFGVKGDGVTDDTVALQAALNSGYNLWFPAGTYVTSANLNITSGITIRGEYRKSIIKRVAGGAAVPVTRTYVDSNGVTQTLTWGDQVVFNLICPTNSYLVDVIIDGLEFNLPSDASVGVFNAQRVAVSVFRHLYAGPASAYFIKGYDMWQVKWADIRSMFSKSHFQIDTGTSNVFSRVYCNTKYSTGGNGFSFTNLDYTIMEGCAADSLDRAYYFTGSHCNVTMVGCGSETFSRVIHVQNYARVTVSGGALWLFKTTGTAGSTFYPFQVDTNGVLTMTGTNINIFDNTTAGATLAPFTVVTGGQVQLNNVAYPTFMATSGPNWWYVADAGSVLSLIDKNGTRHINAYGVSRQDGVSNLKAFEYTKTNVPAGSAQSIFRMPVVSASNGYGENFNIKLRVSLTNAYGADMGFNGLMEFLITGFNETTKTQNLTLLGQSFTLSNTGGGAFGGVTGSLVRNADNTVDFQLNIANTPAVVGNTNVTVFAEYMTYLGTTPSANVIVGL